MRPWVRVPLVLGSGVTTCAAQSTERQFERTFPVSGSVLLDLNTDAGGILVDPIEHPGIAQITIGGGAAAVDLVAAERRQHGQKRPPMRARAAVAVGLARENHDAEAVNAFRQTMPIVLAAAQNPQDDDTINAAAREQRTRIVAESYMTLLARNADSNSAAEAFGHAAAANVMLGDAVARAAQQTARGVVADGGIDVEVLLFDRDGRLVGHAPFASHHEVPPRNRRR